MELLWIILITLAAAGFAFVVGGYVDRKTAARQEIYDQERHEQWLVDIAEFSRGFSELISERAFISREAVPTISKALCAYIMEHGEKPSGNGKAFERNTRA